MKKMKLPNVKKPHFLRFTIPVIDVLKEMGGSGSSSEVQETIIERYDIPLVELDAVNKNGGSKIKNQIAWVRFYLSKAGIIDSSERGVWALTEKGMKVELNPDNVYTLFKEIHKQWGGNRTENKNDFEEEEIEDSSPESVIEKKINYREDLLEILQEKLTPNGFERLSQRLLRESGFTRVEVTGKKSDGGIDGIGILEINPLLSFKVLFQCKRYKGAVGPSEIRDFRGAMAGRADKGLFLTTGGFTQEAKKEAIRDGAAPIELIDGSKLIEMFERLKLGLRPKITFEIDETFFDDYMR
jgi:restriction system protein